MTIMGDIYSVAERAVAQGYIASVWAMSAVVGPTLGGLFSDHLSWRWIFWINLPLGLLAAAVLWIRFDEKPGSRTSAGRSTGGARCCVAGASALLLLGLLEGGIRWPWWSWQSAVVFGGAAAARRPLRAGRGVGSRIRCSPAGCSGTGSSTPRPSAGFVAGVVMLGVTSYVPVYAQQVLGAGATVAGFAVAALAIGWPFAASTSGRIYLRWGFRACLFLGAVFGAAGATILDPGRPGQLDLAARRCLPGARPRPRLRRQPERRRRCSRRSSSASAGSRPAPTCSPARSAARSASRCSVPSPTASSPTGSGERTRPARSTSTSCRSTYSIRRCRRSSSPSPAVRCCLCSVHY